MTRRFYFLFFAYEDNLIDLRDELGVFFGILSYYQ